MWGEGIRWRWRWRGTSRPGLPLRAMNITLSGENLIWDWVVGPHGDGAIAGGDALEGEAQAFGDAESLDGLGGVVGAGGVVTAADVTRGDGMYVTLIELDGCEVESDRHLALRHAGGIEGDEREE